MAFCEMWNPLYIGRVPHFQGKQQNARASIFFLLRQSILLVSFKKWNPLYIGRVPHIK